jgi:curved DNA-binding protein CbpA
MPDFEDYYEILGVGSKATPDEITKAWKDKFWILSPDRMNGAPETAKKRAEEELKKVNNAYDTLKDTQKKQDYDKQWHQIKDKPKPVVDPPNIRFNNVNPKQVKTGSFVIRNLGGPYNKINISNPNTWVKVVRWHSLSDSDELPLQVEIEAVGEDFGKNYTEQININLDDEETSVRIDLQTRPQYGPTPGIGTRTQASSSGSGTPAGSSPTSGSGSRAKPRNGLIVFAGILAVIIIAVGVLLLHNNGSNKNQFNIQTTPSPISSTIPHSQTTSASSFQTPTLSWIRQFGTSESDHAFGINIDKFGYIYIVGETQGTLPGQTSSGGNDAFLIKYDVSGNEIWTRQFGSNGNDNCTCVASDASGNVIVGGTTNGALPNQTQLGGNDAFIRKYDASGNELWTHQFGSNGHDGINGITLDTSGNIFVVGQTVGALPGQLHSSALGYTDAFIRKYDPSGNIIWTHQFGTGAGAMANGVVSDSSGNIYVVGSTYGALSSQIMIGTEDGFVRKYNNAGIELWTQQYGTDDMVYANAVTVDPSGDCFVVGRVYGTLPNQTKSQANYDAYVRKYDSSGKELWTRQFGSGTGDEAEGVTVDKNGNIYLACYTAGSVQGQTYLGNTDAYACSYDNSGVFRWIVQFGSAGSDYAFGIAVGGSGGVYEVGYTSGSLPDQASFGNADAFLCNIK